LYEYKEQLCTIDKMQHRTVSLASRKGRGKKIRKRFRLTPAMTDPHAYWCGEEILSISESLIDSKMATNNNNDNLLRQITEAENSHDVEKLIALVTDDIVIEDVPFVPFGMVMKGKDGVRQGYAFFFEAAPDYKIEPKSWVTSDKSFASEWVLTATQKGDFPGIPASGKRFSIRGCSFGEFENGKLKRKSDYWDYASLKKQLTG
jgi:steroid delta-isomerase-like uncharacterized protein